MNIELMLMKALTAMSKDGFEDTIKDRANAEQLRQLRASGTMDMMLTLLSNMRILPAEQYLEVEPILRIMAETPAPDPRSKDLFLLAADTCPKMAEWVRIAEEFFNAIPAN